MFFSLAIGASAAVSGWRGDGSGCYPNAKPPLKWGRVAKSVTELSAQSRKPKGDTAPGPESALQGGIVLENCTGPVPSRFKCRRREVTISNPVFEKGRIYYRGEYALYCLGSK